MIIYSIQGLFNTYGKRGRKKRQCKSQLVKMFWALMQLLKKTAHLNNCRLFLHMASLHVFQYNLCTQLRQELFLSRASARLMVCAESTTVNCSNGTAEASATQELSTEELRA